MLRQFLRCRCVAGDYVGDDDGVGDGDGGDIEMLKDCGVAQNSCGFICCASFTLVNFGQLSSESKQSSKTMQISNKLATHCTDIQQKMHRKIALIICVCLYELIIFKCSNAFPISDCVFRCSKFYTFSQPIFPCP